MTGGILIREQMVLVTALTGTLIQAMSFIVEISLEDRRVSMAKSRQWYRGKKRRVQKKYRLLLGRYLTPREVRIYFKRKRVEPVEHWTHLGE